MPQIKNYRRAKERPAYGTATQTCHFGRNSFQLESPGASRIPKVEEAKVEGSLETEREVGAGREEGGRSECGTMANCFLSSLC